MLQRHEIAIHDLGMILWRHQWALGGVWSGNFLRTTLALQII